MPKIITKLFDALGTSETSAGEGPVREERISSWIVRLDLSGQVLRIEIPEDREFPEDFKSQGAVEPVLQSTSGDLGGRDFASASELVQKAKQFDDGLYAAVDLAAQQGAGKFAGKRFLLRAIMTGMSSLGPVEGNVPALIFAAAKLGGIAGDVPVRIARSVRKILDDFRSDELRSRPIGFYTWSEDLKGIFSQDRLLQSELEGKKGIEALVQFLRSDVSARAAYESYLALAAKLTNPFPSEIHDLRKAIAESDFDVQSRPSGRICFFPPSMSHETELVQRLYGDRPIPEGFSLADEMVRRIRSGAMRLQPTAASGWYDYQTWALEPMVIPENMPEATHLVLSDSYRKQLLELFKGVLALVRETHVKQLEIPAAGAAPMPKIVLRPKLSAEPVATYYQRRAESYAFVRQVLEGAFGAEALNGMSRLSPVGRVNTPLGREIRQMESIFRGAYQTVSRELGVNLRAATDVRAFEEWLRGMEADPDLRQDSRMMVPIFYDVVRRKIKVWAFLGWTSRRALISFEKPPSVQVLDASTRRPAKAMPEIALETSYLTLRYPVAAEVYVSRLLNRDEFRRLCDTQKTRSAIIRCLQ